MNGRNREWRKMFFFTGYTINPQERSILNKEKVNQMRFAWHLLV